jgi:hypothetical protein
MERNGNREPPLWTFFTDHDHVVRAAWRSHGRNAPHIAHIHMARPDVPIVVLTSRREIADWLLARWRSPSPTATPRVSILGAPSEDGVRMLKS